MTKSKSLMRLKMTLNRVHVTLQDDEHKVFKRDGRRANEVFLDGLRTNPKNQGKLPFTDAYRKTLRKRLINQVNLHARIKKNQGIS